MMPGLLTPFRKGSPLETSSLRMRRRALSVVVVVDGGLFLLSLPSLFMGFSRGLLRAVSVDAAGCLHAW